MKFAVAFLLGCLIAFAPDMTQAAAIVKATYSQDGEEIASMVYTGPDGRPRSDPAMYWELLGKAPEITSDVKIEPDMKDGKTATLKGDIVVSVEIRNRYSMGTVKTDELKLVRDDDHSKKWYMPAEELKRIRALVEASPKP